MKRVVCSRLSNLKVDDWMEENDLQFTSNPSVAIYLTPQGKLISGMSTCGDQRYGRDIDHRVIESLVNRSRYDENFWRTALTEARFVMIIPENRQYLLVLDQDITPEQDAVLEGLNSSGWERIED